MEEKQKEFKNIEKEVNIAERYRGMEEFIKLSDMFYMQILQINILQIQWFEKVINYRIDRQ